MKTISKIVSAVIIISLFIIYFFLLNNFIKTKAFEIEQQASKNLLEVKKNMHILNEELAKIEDTQVKIVNLNNEIINQNIKLEALKLEIQNLKNQTPEAEKIKFTFLKVLNKIQILINNNENISNELDQLILLANGDSTLLLELNKLKNYSNKKSIQNTINVFDLESNNKYLFVDGEYIEKKKSIFDNLFKIRKITNKKNTENIKNNILTIRKEIVNLNYQNALISINNFNYQSFFKETIVNLENEIEFNKIINNIIILIN